MKKLLLTFAIVFASVPAYATCENTLNILDWYFIADDFSPTTQRFASGRGLFVATSDSAYITWTSNPENCATEYPTAAQVYKIVSDAAEQNRPWSYNTISSAANVALTNPLPGAALSGNDLGTYTDFNISTSGKTVTLPQANLPISMPMGRSFRISNANGSNAFTIKDFLGNTIVSSLLVGWAVDIIPNSFATTGGAYGNWIQYLGGGVVLQIAQGGIGASSVLGAQDNFAIGTTHCGSLIGADFNSTADQSVTITKPGSAIIYRVVRMNTTNATVSLTTAAGGVYTGATKTGGVPIPAATTYSAITNRTANTAGNGQATAGASNLVLTATTLFFALTTPQGAPATADLDFYCEPVR